MGSRGGRQRLRRWHPHLCADGGRSRDPRIHLVDASARRGAAAARNIGVRAARGSLLAFCDADDVVRPGWIAPWGRPWSNADLVAGVFDFGALDGSPTDASGSGSHPAIGLPPVRPERQSGGAEECLRGDPGIRRGPVARRGRRPVLAPATGGIPVRRGSRRRRGEARTCVDGCRSSVAHGPTGDAGRGCYVRYRAKGMRRDFGERQSRGSGWWPPCRAIRAAGVGVNGSERSPFDRAAWPDHSDCVLLPLDEARVRRRRLIGLPRWCRREAAWPP